jgi:hypothetical protein
MDLINPPSGTFVPIALAALSAPVAFVDGVEKSVPFDELLFNKGSALKFPDPAIPGFSIGGGPGLWLVQAQFTLSVAPTTVLAKLVAESGSQTTQSSIKQAAATQGALTLSGLFLNSTAPLQADNVFTGFQLLITGTGAGGNITGAQLLVFRLGNA